MGSRRILSLGRKGASSLLKRRFVSSEVAGIADRATPAVAHAVDSGRFSSIYVVITDDLACITRASSNVRSSCVISDPANSLETEAKLIRLFFFPKKRRREALVICLLRSTNMKGNLEPIYAS